MRSQVRGSPAGAGPVRSASALLLGVGALVVVLAAAGCGQQKQLTLRQAEEIGQLWLDDLQRLVSPKPPTPKPQDAHEAKHGAEDTPEPPGPRALRDLFVDDGWRADGFLNPVAAVAWLKQTRWKVGEMTSAELVEGGTEMDFDLVGDKPVAVHARIVVQGGAVKCQSLKKGE